MANVQVYSHFFTVKNSNNAIKRILYNIAGDYTVFGMVFDERRRKKVWKPVKTFGFYTLETDTFRFHIAQFKQFMDAVSSSGEHVHIEKIPLYIPDSVDYVTNPKMKLRPDQEKAAEFIMDDSDAEAHYPLLSMPTGTGKSLSSDSQVLTGDGFKRIDELVLGESLQGCYGQAMEVTGIYPQGVLDVYEVVFEDGRSVKCSDDHLWAIRKEGEDFLEVTELKHFKDRLNEESLYIPLIKGYSSRSRAVRTGIDYLLKYHSFEQKENHICFLVYDRWIAEYYIEATRRCGGIASIIFNVNMDAWEITIDLRQPSPYNLLGDPAYENYGFLKIVSVRHVGKSECICISVSDKTQLFVTNDYIVTHNTVTALTAAARLGKRISISVLAGYVDKWVEDCQNILMLDDEDIFCVSGKNSVVDLCQMAIESQSDTSKLPKVIIYSLNTIGRWQNAYINKPSDPELSAYGLKPWELSKMCRIGTNIFDENHQHLHAVYRMFCFLHVPKTISLSATMLSKDQTELRIQRMMYPRAKRFEEIKMRQYIKSYACQYQIHNFIHSRIRTSEFGSNNYSHVAFEKSILSHRTLRFQYIKMIVAMVEGSYHKDFKPGDKCAVFVSTHAMAKEVCKAIKAKLPNYDTRTYLEEDPYENAIDSDIRVTTILSGGTAIDIPGLCVSILTVSIDSPKSNIQVLGRLREIPGREVRFYYLYCSSIPKQVDYHKNKLDLIKERTAEQNDLHLEALIP